MATGPVFLMRLTVSDFSGSPHAFVMEVGLELASAYPDIRLAPHYTDAECTCPPYPLCNPRGCVGL